jgi:hypothetical protein
MKFHTLGNYVVVLCDDLLTYSDGPSNGLKGAKAIMAKLAANLPILHQMFSPMHVCTSSYFTHEKLRQQSWPPTDILCSCVQLFFCENSRRERPKWEKNEAPHIRDSCSVWTVLLIWIIKPLYSKLQLCHNINILGVFHIWLNSGLLMRSNPTIHMLL